MDESLVMKLRKFASTLRKKLFSLENQIDNDCFIDKKMITKSNTYQEILEEFEEIFDDVL
jgi:hypothetical protein